MNAALWGKAREAMAALDRWPAEERPSRVGEVCGGDAQVEAEVRSLLEAESSAGGASGSGSAVVLAALDGQGGVFGRLGASGGGSGVVAGAGWTDARALTGMRLGGCVLGEVIGRGRSGVVLAGYDQRAQRAVAVKVLRCADEPAMRRLLIEGRALARLNHRHIATVHEVGEAAGVGPYLVMELVPGADVVRFSREMPLRRRVELLVQACSAVEHAHQRGVLHRDLKPGNVLAYAEQPGGGDVVKVLDFGLARLTDESPDTLATLPGGVLGTLAYMSPEQAAGEPADTRSDVYGLAAIGCEMLTGHPPVEVTGLTVLGALRAIGERPVHLGGPWAGIAADADLALVLGRALAKDVGERYPSVAEFRADLERWLGGEAISARRHSRVYVLRTWVRRNRALAAAAGLAIAACVGVTAAGAWAIISSYRAEQADGLTRASVDALLAEVVRLEADRIGGNAQTQRVVEQVAAILGPLVQRQGLSGANAELYATLLSRLADVAQREQRWSDAAKWTQQAEALWRERAEEAGDPTQDAARAIRKRWSVAMVRVGDIAGETGDTEAQARWYRAALEVDEALVREDGRDAGALSNLVYSYQRLAALARNRGDLTEALSLAERHVRGADSLLELAGPDAERQSSALLTAASARAVLGSVLDYIGRTAEADTVRQEQLRQVRALRAAQPHRRGVRVMAAGLCARLAHEASVNGDSRAAKRWRKKHWPTWTHCWWPMNWTSTPCRPSTPCWRICRSARSRPGRGCWRRWSGPLSGPSGCQRRAIRWSGCVRSPTWPGRWHWPSRPTGPGPM